MPGIAAKVAILGIGWTRFGEHWDKSAEDMMVDAAFEAFEDARVSPQDIQAAWVGTTPSGATGQALSHLLQLLYIPMTRADNARATAQEALCNACFALLPGCTILLSP
jgi:acetyl-CoA C-acetyltransferase